jgi:hypothetical protein
MLRGELEGTARNDKESKKKEDNSEQVTKSNEVLAHVCLRTVQVVCFLRQRDVFKIRW